MNAPGPGRGKGPLAARPGYAVGYGKPPEATRFQKGQSGNPRGRPKGKKIKLPGLNEERMKQIIIEEAYRDISVREGARTVTVPIARAVLRALAVNAVRGQHRAQRLFAELLASVETSNKLLHDSWLDTAMGYKIDWERELARRARFGITNLPEPLPHPDDIVIDLRKGTARIAGPATREEKAEWDLWLARRQEFEEELAELEADLETATDERTRKILLEEAESTRKVLDILNRAFAGSAADRTRRKVLE